MSDTSTPPEAGACTVAVVDPMLRRVWSAARRARDARFDGTFFVGVRTTGIYCRPTCPARTALERNVEYFTSAAAAGSRGYVACLRCRPESAAPYSPLIARFEDGDEPLARAMRLIDGGALDSEEGGGQGWDAVKLAAELGVGERSLRRAFLSRFGATPSQIAMTRRLHLARQLLLGSNLRCADIGYAVGFGSPRRFQHAIRRAFGRTPAKLRAKLREREDGVQGAAISLTLGYRPPLAWEQLLGFLETHAIAGIDEVVDSTYRRAFDISGQRGILTIRNEEAHHRLKMELTMQDRSRTEDGGVTGLSALLPITQKIRQVFDLAGDPRRIAEHFANDPILAPRIERCPGIRVPGAWDAYELVVRVVLGQQVTVRGGTTLTARFVETFGSSWVLDQESVNRKRWFSFPEPSIVVKAGVDEIAAIGLPPSRAKAVHGVSKFFSEGGGLDPTRAVSDNVAALQNLRGIGPWTAQTVAMRALHDPDAFPAEDLVLRQRLARDLARATEPENPSGKKPLVSVTEARELAQSWRPFRAYALMLLWQVDPDPRAGPNRQSAGLERRREE